MGWIVKANWRNSIYILRRIENDPLLTWRNVMDKPRGDSRDVIFKTAEDAYTTGVEWALEFGERLQEDAKVELEEVPEVGK